MGMAKRQMEEDEERGWSSVGEKWCCADHVEDEALETLIAAEAISTTCSYCEHEAAGPIAAPVDVIVERFAESLPQEWGGADEETIPWEGGYVWETLDTWDLVTDGLNWPLNDSDLIADVVWALPEQAWVQRDFYRLTPSERLRFAWSDFVQIVKHERRYFFSDHSVEGEEPDDPDKMTPGGMLTAIGEVVGEASLVRDLDPGETLFRARTHGRQEALDGAANLGAPPADCVLSSSRMSPAGVSMFYGAFDLATAKEEARTANPDAEALTVGRFDVVAPLRVLDLSQPPDVPSLFDAERRSLRPGHIFLRHFVEEIAKSFVHDEKVHIEYVPTQIVTEWFASGYRDGLDGLLYRSARSPEGVNAALFFDERGCRDPSEIDEDARLVFKEVVERSRAVAPGPD